MKLRQLGEDRLLDQLLYRLPFGKTVAVGAGDDCALVAPPAGRNFLVLKTERPLSDFAATSALPQFALITLIAPKETEVGWVREFYRGLRKAAARFKVSIVGGETSSTRGPIAVSVSVVGFVEKNRWVSRRSGKVGDDLFVTGQLGGAIKRKHLHFVPRIAESRWLTKNFSIHAMIDLSDGLGIDLPRLARASKVGFEIELENLPLNRGAKIGNAISDGEDYELLFASSPRQSKRLLRSWRQKFPRLPLTRIGSLIPQSAVRNPQLPGGYVHFQ